MTQRTIDPFVYAILRGFPFYNDSLTNVCNEIVGFLVFEERSVDLRLHGADYGIIGRRQMINPIIDFCVENK